MENKPRCFFILPTNSIGGAEKRFIELWNYLQSNNGFCFNLVVSKELGSAAGPDLKAMMDNHADHVYYYAANGNEGVYGFQKKLYSFVDSVAQKNDILHFIIAYPSLLLNVRQKKTVYTLTESSLKNANLKGKLGYLLNILRAGSVDILDPLIYKKLRLLFFFKRKRLHLTPGSFVNAAVFCPAAGVERKNELVFLGRFYAMKQVLELLHAVPAVCSLLDKNDITGYSFTFIGYGPLEEEMRLILNSEPYTNLPVKIMQTNNPEQILNTSKVFFSVQLNNNYPSKSLMEAMAAGNIPLVTDVGTTRQLAHPDFSYYVPEKFTADEIAAAVLRIFTTTAAEQQQKAQRARQYVIDNYSIKASADYYFNLYKSLL